MTTNRQMLDRLAAKDRQIETMIRTQREKLAQKDAEIAFLTGERDGYIRLLTNAQADAEAHRALADTLAQRLALYAEHTPCG